MKRFGVCILIGLLFLTGCCTSRTAKQSPELILRYADNQPEGYPTTEAAQYFAKLVEERTNGEIIIRVYPNGELGGENSVIQQVQFGGIDMCRACMGTLAGVMPELNVLQLPFLYTDSEHMFRVLDSEIGDAFLSGMQEVGLYGLSWFDAGARSFYTRQPIHTLEDLQNMRIRVQDSDAMSCMVELLGAIPIKVDYGDVYSAMQTGKIDGADNNWPSYVSAGHYETACYFLQDEHSRLPEMQIISLDAMEKIAAVDETYVDVICQCAKESALYERELWKQREAEAKTLALERGCCLIELEQTELEKFKQAVQPMYEALSEEDKKIVEQIRQS